MATPAQIACGLAHTLVVDTDGALWATGSNVQGQLGHLGANQPAFTAVPRLDGITSVACGHGHSAVIDSDQRLRASGANALNELGRFRSLAIRVGSFMTSGDRTAAHVACGAQHTAIIDTDRALWTAGAGNFGRLGRAVGGRGEGFVETPVGEGGVLDVACGDYHTVVIDLEHQVWVVGSNVRHQLGNEGVSTAVFRKLDGIEAAGVACGAEHTAIVDTDGAVWLFGSNNSGQLGHEVDPSWKPTKAPGIVAADVSCGIDHTVIVDVDGVVWVAGSNVHGQLGLERVDYYAEFVPVPNVTASAVACGGTHTALISDSGLLMAGSSEEGQLGCGTAASHTFTSVEIGTQRARVAAEVAGDEMTITEAYHLADAALN